MLSDVQRKKFTYLFKVMDTEKNGNINKNDFLIYVRNYASLYDLNVDSPAYDKLKSSALHWWTKIHDLIDKDKDLEITLQEWLAFQTMYTEELVQRDDTQHLYSFVITLFDLVDKNSDGAVGLSEYTQFLRAWGIETDFKAVFRRLTGPDSDTLTRNDFVNLLWEFYTSSDPDAAGNYIFGPFSPDDPLCTGGVIKQFLTRLFN